MLFIPSESEILSRDTPMIPALVPMHLTVQFGQAHDFKYLLPFSLLLKRSQDDMALGPQSSNCLSDEERYLLPFKCMLPAGHLAQMLHPVGLIDGQSIHPKYKNLDQSIHPKVFPDLSQTPFITMTLLSSVSLQQYDSTQNLGVPAGPTRIVYIEWIRFTCFDFSKVDF
jgi:hypothetical protein